MVALGTSALDYHEYIAKPRIRCGSWGCRRWPVTHVGRTVIELPLATTAVVLALRCLRLARRPEAAAIPFSWKQTLLMQVPNELKSRGQLLVEGWFGLVLGTIGLAVGAYDLLT